MTMANICYARDGEAASDERRRRERSLRFSILVSKTPRSPFAQAVQPKHSYQSLVTVILGCLFASRAYRTITCLCISDAPNEYTELAYFEISHRVNFHSPRRPSIVAAATAAATRKPVRPTHPSPGTFGYRLGIWRFFPATVVFSVMLSFLLPLSAVLSSKH